MIFGGAWAAEKRTSWLLHHIGSLGCLYPSPRGQEDRVLLSHTTCQNLRIPSVYKDLLSWPVGSPVRNFKGLEDWRWVWRDDYSNPFLTNCLWVKPSIPAFPGTTNFHVILSSFFTSNKLRRVRPLLSSPQWDTFLSTCSSLLANCVQASCALWFWFWLSFQRRYHYFWLQREATQL